MDQENKVADLGSKVAVLENCYHNLTGVVIEEKRRLNGNLERIGQRLDDLDNKLDSFRAEISGVKAEALSTAAQKPSWSTTYAITVLVGLVCTLGTWIITKR